MTPVRRWLMKSWYSQMVAAAAHTCGSCLLIHSDFGTIHSALTGPSPPLFTRMAGSRVAAASPASAALRMSIHSSAGRSGLPPASSATTVQQVVSTLMAAMSAGCTSAAASAPLMALPMPCHQSSGCCSAHPGLGNCVSYSTAWDPFRCPCRSNTAARMDSVPPSMARRNGLVACPLPFAIVMAARSLAGLECSTRDPCG
mmetsp:Transcript_21911/g.55773  ORF Transcript_21911/g.55773 Transcript_21911/m.55773 type:complete len:200 (-) Transcript_21911:92-691(-)